MPSTGHTLVLYDGVCGLCNRLVNFLLRHDRGDRFRFAALQSEFAQGRLRRHRLDPSDFDTVVVLSDFGQPTEQVFTRAQAAIRAIEQLGGIWQLARVCRIIPGPLRNAAYNLIARHRYRIFGKYDECPLPRPEDRRKFLPETELPTPH